MKIKWAVIIILIVGCAIKPGKNNQNKPLYPEMSIFMLHSDSPDSLYLELYLLVPNRNLVFIKQSNDFKANIGISVNITNMDDNEQIEHISWPNEVIEKYYEDTRSDTEYSTFHHRFELPVGKYRIFTNIQDKDSNRNWTLKDEFTLENFTGFSKILPMVWDVDTYKYTGSNISNESDSVFCRFQLNLPDSPDTISLIVIHQETKYVLVEKSLDINNEDSEFMYTVSIPVDITWGVDPILEFQISEYTQELQLTYKHHSVETYWEDPNLALEIMAYYLPVINYKELKKKSKQEKLQYIAQFWKERDPEPETKENELMIEFHTRVMYSIEHFSNLGSGWRSDRGRVYIDNGSPSFTELSQSNDNGYSYLVWYYPSGKQFVFIDENGFGDFRLIREVN